MTVLCRRLPSGGTPCESKRPYANRKTAAYIAAKVRRERGKPVKAYHCPQCGAWHIGHEIGSQRA